VLGSEEKIDLMSETPANPDDFGYGIILQLHRNFVILM